MTSAPKYSLVVPCYNEERNLRPLLEAFKAALNGEDLELIIVDNGSTDGTRPELDLLLPMYPFARSVRTEPNRGYGAGILKGLDAAAGEYVGWTHGDLQSPPAAALKAVALAGRTGGDRFLIKGLRRGRPLGDRFFTAAMALFESLLFGANLCDINGQPTLFHRSLLETWASPPQDFSLDLYASVTALKAGFGVIRFGVENAPRERGASSWNKGLGSRLALAARTIAASLKIRAALARGTRA